MSPYDLLVTPFVEDGDLRRALLGTALLSLSACPVGVLLVLRRMSLSADVLGHAMLPGAAIGFLLFGLAPLPLALGGLAAGVVVALLAGVVSRATVLREEAALAGLYPVSVAIGVALISAGGSSDDLLHVLFGALGGFDAAALALVVAVVAATFSALAILRRAIVADTLDPTFLRTVSGVGPFAHAAFLVLVMLNIVAGFAILGALLAVALMLLPAVAARLWAKDLATMTALALVFALVSTAGGLLVSHHLGVASGAAIVLAAGAVYAGSLPLALLGPALRLRRAASNPI